MVRFDKFLRGVVAAGVLSGGGVAEGRNVPQTPSTLTRQDLAPVLPRQLEKIPTADRIAVATHALRFIDQSFGGKNHALSTFTDLDADEQSHLAGHVLEVTRLCLVMMRNGLLEYSDLLDAAQLTDLRRTEGLLRTKRVAVPSFEAIQQQVRQLMKTAEGKKKLYAMYQEGRSALGDRPPVAAPSVKPPPSVLTRPERDTIKPPDAGVDAGTEFPHGACGRDQDGQPYGWGFQNYCYTEGDGNVPNLVPFRGFETSGNPIEVRLRQDAFDELQKVRQEFDATVPKDSILWQVGFYLSEAYRSYADQVAIKKAKGDMAALPGNSEHHLGTAFDLLNAKYRILYEWFMELSHTSRDPTYVPRAIRHGIIPTAPGEAWHYRYVGQEEALRFWQKYREQIINRHSRLMLDVDNGLLAQLRTRAKNQNSVSGRK